MPSNHPVIRELMRFALDNSPDIIYIQDVQSGDYLYANSAIEKILGYTPEELINGGREKAIGIFHPDDRETLRNIVGVLEKTGHGVFEFRPMTKDGRYRWLSYKMSLVKDKDGKPIYRVGNARDITEQKEAQAKKKVDDDRLAYLLKAAKIGEWELDLKTMVSKISANHALIFGYPPVAKEWKHDEYTKHILAEDIDMVRAKIQEALTEKKNTTIEYRIRRRDGEIRWMSSTGCHYGDEKVAGIVQDITERKEIEAKNKINDDRLEFALRAANIGEFEIDLATGKAKRSLNHAKLFGYDSTDEEWTLDTFFEHIFEEDRQRVAEVVKDAFKEKKDWSFECRIWRRDSILRWIWVSGRYCGDEKVAGIVQDITERKLAEARRLAIEEHLNIMLEHNVNQRTAALMERTEQLRILASELTMAEQRERKRLAEKMHDNLQQLLVGASLQLAALAKSEDKSPAKIKSLQDLIDQSIACSRSLSSELCPPVLHGGLADSLAWLAEWMKQQYGLDVSLSIKNCEPKSEELKIMLFQSIRELLFNIVKHSGVKEASVEMYPRNGSIVAVVADKGKGFCPQSISNAQGKPGHFGLFTIRERIECLGGTVKIESERGKGSRFTLSVPLEKPPESLTDAGAGYI